ncbi:MAG: hypothetical protein ACREDR_06810 [Blastocatellia bacterium]
MNSDLKALLTALRAPICEPDLTHTVTTYSKNTAAALHAGDIPTALANFQRSIPVMADLLEKLGY